MKTTVGCQNVWIVFSVLATSVLKCIHKILIIIATQFMLLTIWLHRITQCTQSRIANPPLLLQLRRAVTMVVWLHETITHMYSVTCALPFIWTPTYPAEAQKCMSSLLCVSAQWTTTEFTLPQCVDISRASWGANHKLQQYLLIRLLHDLTHTYIELASTVTNWPRPVLGLRNWGIGTDRTVYHYHTAW